MRQFGLEQISLSTFHKIASLLPSGTFLFLGRGFLINLFRLYHISKESPVTITLILFDLSLTQSLLGFFLFLLSILFKLPFRLT